MKRKKDNSVTAEEITDYFRGLKNLARIIGVPYSTVHQWFNYRSINHRGALLIEKYSDKYFKAEKILNLKYEYRGSAKPINYFKCNHRE